MTHPDWELQRERLSAYLDGETTGAERAALETHLLTCEECQRELAALRQTRALLRALPEPALPRSFALPPSAPTATPATVRRVGPRWARPAQALGGIAAMIGVGFLVATSLPGLTMHSSMAGGATMASSAPLSPSPTVSNGDVFGGSASVPQSTLQSATKTPATETPADANHTASGSKSPTTVTHAAQPAFPVAPVTGGALLVGGAAAFGAGSLARRRARRTARRTAEADH